MDAHRFYIRALRSMFAAFAVAYGTPSSWADSSQTFAPPTHNGYRVDICATWAKGCGEPAATQFCKLKGFDKAQGWSIAKDIGGATPTVVIGDNKMCAQPTCDGFASVTCTKAGSPRTAASQGNRAPSRIDGPIATTGGQAVAKKLNLTMPPAPGPAAVLEFSFAYQPRFTVAMQNFDFDDNNGFVLNRLKNPLLQVRFKAAADTHYGLECATRALNSPFSTGYTLDWSSDLWSEKQPGPRAETLLLKDNLEWIFAAIPKQSLARWITVRASGFTSSRSLLFCRLTPYQ